MQRRERPSYVNDPVRPKPVCSLHPSERKWCQILLLSFGLLCLIQATLNITLRLTSKSKYNTTGLESQTSPPGEETQQCNGLQERVKALEGERNRLNNQITRANDKINELNNKNRQLNNEINELNNKNSVLTNQNSNLKNQNNDLNNQNNNLINQINNLNNQNSNLDNQINGLNNIIIELRDRNRALNDQIRALTRREAVTVKPVCPEGWWKMRSRCYLLSSQSEKRSWESSRSYCQRRGADLVVIRNAQEQRDLYRMDGDSNLLFWIGLYKDTSSGTFKWVDNTPLTTAFWQDGQPGDGGPNNPENCVEMYHKNPVLSSWNDARCGDARRWVCEKEARQ